MSKWKKVNINQIAIQEHNAQQEMLSMIEGIKAKAEADGFDVEFFYDEIILTTKKD